MKTGLISGECLARRELPASAKAEREWARFAARNKILFAVPEVAGRLGVGSCAMWRRPPWLRRAFAPCGSGSAPPMSRRSRGRGGDQRRTAPLEYRTACGERLDIVLPDGSKVCMNSEATLTVDPGFGKATREIEFGRRGVFHHFTRQKLSVHHPPAPTTTIRCWERRSTCNPTPGRNFAVVTLLTGCLQAQVRKDVIILDPLDTAIVFWIAASALSFILALFVSKKSHA